MNDVEGKLREKERGGELIIKGTTLPAGSILGTSSTILISMCFKYLYD